MQDFLGPVNMDIQKLKQENENINIFLQLAEIPSPSFKEEVVSKKIMELLDVEGIEAKQDEYGNVIATIRATDTSKQSVLLSAHMDVVGNSSPVNIRISEDCKFFETDKTRSLGADDKAGIASAIVLARKIASEKDFLHGGLELVFTRDEEKSLTGIKHLNSKQLNSKYVLVVDSDKLGDILISGAGYTNGLLKVKTFIGGHSGVDINDTRRLNAVKLIAELVNQIPQGVIKRDETGTITSINIGATIGGGVDAPIEQLIEENHKNTCYIDFVAKNAVTNVINTYATATYSIRSSDSKEEKQLLKKIQLIINNFNEKYETLAEASFVSEVKMLPFEKSNDIYMQKVVEEAAMDTGIKSYVGSCHAGAETHIYKYLENQKGEFFIPYLIGVANNYNTHSNEEKVEINSLIKGAEFVENIFRRFNK